MTALFIIFFMIAFFLIFFAFFVTSLPRPFKIAMYALGIIMLIAGPIALQLISAPGARP